MIQDIGEGRFRNEYKNEKPQENSRLICARKGEVLFRQKDGEISYLTVREAEQEGVSFTGNVYYLFSMDGISYFLPMNQEDVAALEKCGGEDMRWHSIREFRNAKPKELAFAGISAYQLYDWYSSRLFCPHCGKPLVHSKAERMMECPSCGLTEYPKISPAVIVGVLKDDKILMTKYAGRDYTNYALIAGFTEFGETVEGTVRREVMEEVGLKVKNIRYYKSQPWAFSSTLLMGFFCDADGDEEIHLDRSELSVGEWCTRDQIPDYEDLSLTNEMMQVFRSGTVPEYQSPADFSRN